MTDMRPEAPPVRYVVFVEADEGLVQALVGEECIGRLVFHVNHCFFPEVTLYPDELFVAKGYRRRGVATAMQGPALDSHPHLPMTYKLDALSDDALLALPAFARAHPGRLKLYDDERGTYLAIQNAALLCVERD